MLRHTVGATAFKTTAGSRTFSFFSFSWAASAETYTKNQQAGISRSAARTVISRKNEQALVSKVNL
jgi:hypothetical protein